MHNKLDKLALSAEDDEQTIPEAIAWRASIWRKPGQRRFGAVLKCLISRR
jgi:hypothetical protein